MTSTDRPLGPLQAGKSEPVYMRVGDGAEYHIGNVDADPLASRESTAAFLRAVADQIEQAEESVTTGETRPLWDVDEIGGERARTILQLVLHELGINPDWRGETAEQQVQARIAELREQAEEAARGTSNDRATTRITDVYQVVTFAEPIDEGGERIEAGTYVIGGEYADDDGAEIVVRIDHAIDVEGYDITQYVAERIKFALKEDAA
ncbi:hypothetical protein [Saccharopolyspora sp. NPDC002376]